MHSKGEIKKKLTLVLLGRSGCGKGTQARHILRRLKGDSYHIETGRFLRNILKSHSNVTTNTIRRLMNDGRLMPPWSAVFCWLKELIEHGAAAFHLLFDGAPRTVWEAELLDSIIAWHGRSLPVCISLDITEAEATNRLLHRGRGDDTRTAIKNRMSFFKKDVSLVLGYYKKRKRLIRIDGAESPDAVWAEIDHALKKRFRSLWHVS